MAKGKFGGLGGGMNMQAMIKQAQKMQQDMLKAQEEIAVMETEAQGSGTGHQCAQGTGDQARSG